MSDTNDKEVKSTGMPEEPVRRTGNGKLAVCLVGGGVAWLFHLILAVVLAEFGCVAGWDANVFLGINLVAWMLLAVTVVALAACAAATILCWKEKQDASNRIDAEIRGGGPLFLIQSGLIANVSFFFVIAVQSIPIFYFLGNC